MYTLQDSVTSPPGLPLFVSMITDPMTIFKQYNKNVSFPSQRHSIHHGTPSHSISSFSSLRKPAFSRLRWMHA